MVWFQHVPEYTTEVTVTSVCWDPHTKRCPLVGLQLGWVGPLMVNFSERNIASKTPLKRRCEHSETNSDDDCFSLFCNFLVIQVTDQEKPFRKLSPFATVKGLQCTAVNQGRWQECSGDLVEVTQSSHFKNLLRSTMVVSVPIKVTIQKTLNWREGVVSCKWGKTH